MGRNVNHVNIETPTARKKRKPGKKFALHNLVRGRAALGYQKLHKGKPGRWVLRETTGTNRYRVTALGMADDDYAEADGKNVLTFAQAVDAATAAYKGELSAVEKSLVTVKDVILDYVKYLQAHKATGRDAEWRVKKLILPQLGKLRLSDLTTAKLYEWRDALAESPALTRTAIGGKQQYKPMPKDADGKRKRRSSANKSLTILKAS